MRAGWGGLRRVAVIAVVGAGIPAACTSSTDAPGSAHDSGTQDSGGTAFAQSACGACVSSACSPEVTTCGGEPGCASYLQCLMACPAVDGGFDPACEAACPRGSTSAELDAEAAFTACRTTGAGAACAGCKGDGGGVEAGTNPVLDQQCGPSTETDVCQKCLAEQCCDSVDAITNGGPATQLSSCYTACNDSACDLGCFDQYPDGIVGMEGFGACLGVKCIATGACKASSGCSKCEYQNCPQEFANCATNKDCDYITECALGCAFGDTACAKACKDKYPGGADAADALGICATQLCKTAC